MSCWFHTWQVYWQGRAVLHLVQFNILWSRDETWSLSWGSRCKLNGDGEKWVQAAVRIKQKQKLNESGWVRGRRQHRCSVLQSELDVRFSALPFNNGQHIFGRTWWCDNKVDLWPFDIRCLHFNPQVIPLFDQGGTMPNQHQHQHRTSTWFAFVMQRTFHHRQPKNRKSLLLQRKLKVRVKVPVSSGMLASISLERYNVCCVSDIGCCGPAQRVSM